MNTNLKQNLILLLGAITVITFGYVLTVTNVVTLY